MSKVQRYRELSDINKIVIHHSASNGSKDNIKTLEAINEHHSMKLHPKANNYGYHIAYHFIIFKDGQVIKTRPLKEIGYQAGHWETNCTSIGICLIGNFEEDIPTEDQLRSLKALFAEYMQGLKISKVLAHREVKPTACPGKNFSDDMIKALLPIDKKKQKLSEVINYLSQDWLDMEERQKLHHENANKLREYLKDNA